MWRKIDQKNLSRYARWQMYRYIRPPSLAAVEVGQEMEECEGFSCF